MISTRLHGVIDYAVACLFGGLAVSKALTPPVRRVLGAAGAYHASYAALTDYEAGLLPRLTMRQHLALDTLGAGGLCATGLLMRRQPAAARAFLIAAGAAELAIISASSTAPVSGPGQGGGPLDRLAGDPDQRAQAGYPPLDTPKPFAPPDLFIVDSLLPSALGRVLAARMTVIRLPGGDLLLHSPTRFSPALLRRVEQLGRIRHFVAPSFAHWIFLPEWQRACPEATVWAAPGLRRRAQVRRSGLRLDHDLPDGTPEAWGGAMSVVIVPGGLGFHEAALFHAPSRTLVLTDLVLNLEPERLPAMLRPLIRAFGSMAPDGMPPPYLRALVRLRGRAASHAASRLLALRPERVVFAHGRCFEQDATEALRRSLRWLTAQTPRVSDSPGA